MELVVVNGSNAISRGVLSRFASKQYKKIKFLDIKPYRQSVYAFQKTLPSGVQLEKHMVNNYAGLEHNIEGAKDVLYFTHDYFANAADKNNFIQATAKVAKKHGVQRLVAVCPIEHELYYTEDKDTPQQKVNEAQQKALENNKNMTILNTNLVYGKDASYLIHFMTQCVYNGRVPKSIGNSTNFAYKPISADDLAKAVETAYSSFNEAKGQRFAVNGQESATLNSILGVLESAVGGGEGSTKLQKSVLGLNVSDYIEEFFVGITHDKNMARLAEYFDNEKINLLDEGSQDFFSKFGLRHQKNFRDSFKSEKIREDDLVFPTFSNYKMTSLD